MKKNQFGSTLEALLYPTLLLIVLWTIYWAEQLFHFPFYKLGVLPKTLEGMKGVLFMSFIHSKEPEHLINNSGPIFILLATLIYFYRSVALKTFLYIWLISGALIWLFAANKGSYHIGISGVIYGLAAFLFFSGYWRKYLPLQAISLFVAFFYGSMVWGVLPYKPTISWEGHLMGMLVGIFLAYRFRKIGPVRPKYQYEIEKEMGIEPPDLEGIWVEQQVRLEEERIRQNIIRQAKQPIQTKNENESQNRVLPKQNLTDDVKIVYHFKKKEE